MINHIIDLRDYPGGDLIHLLAIRKKEMSSYRTVIRQSGLEPKRSCGTQDPVRESFPMAKYTMSAVDRGVSDVSAPRFFLDSRKDFSWPRSTRIHEAKSR